MAVKKYLDLDLTQYFGTQIVSGIKDHFVQLEDADYKNTIKSITVGGDTVTPTNKVVALGEMAGKDEIAESDLASALATKINGKANDADLAAVAKSGDSEDVSYDNTTSGLTATDVQGAIDEVAAASAGGVDSKTVYMTDASSGQTEFAKVYNIYQGANGSTASPDVSELVGTINVPKDMVVTDASLQKVTTADTPYSGAVVGDPYIDLTIANATQSHIYIPVKDLVDVYTAGNGLTLANGQFSVVINTASANGLSVGANGVELAVATTTTAGAMSAADKAKLDDADVTAYTGSGAIDVINHVISIDAAVASTSGEGGSAGTMSAADKEKLDNADVTAYTAGNGVDITSHAVSAVVDSSNANGLSVGASGIALATATTSAAGAMSAADKAKLDGADVSAYSGTGAVSVTNHEISVAAATPSTSGTGGNAGTMSATDKEKLDNITDATQTEVQGVVDDIFSAAFPTT